VLARHHAPSVFYGLLDLLRDPRRGFVKSERDRPFETLRSGDQDPNAAPERVRGHPGFERLSEVLSGGLHGRLDALALGGGDSLAVENGLGVLGCGPQSSIVADGNAVPGIRQAGARISEVLGLQWRHVNLDAGTIKIEQRVWRQEVGSPKSEGSRRVLGIGDLAARFRARATEDGAMAESFVFQQARAPGRPLWDSGVRDALHQAAEAEGCGFPGLGPHSFRRANITWRQQVGGSAIEASKIAGHSDLEMTGEYTFVTAERQNELTRRIQQQLAEASQQGESTPASNTTRQL